MKTPCDHYFCSECLSSIFKQKVQNEIDCPVCTEPLDVKFVTGTDKRFSAQIMALTVHCEKCQAEGLYKDMGSHRCCMIKAFSSAEQPKDSRPPEKSLPKSASTNTSPMDLDLTVFGQIETAVPVVSGSSTNGASTLVDASNLALNSNILLTPVATQSTPAMSPLHSDTHTPRHHRQQTPRPAKTTACMTVQTTPTIDTSFNTVPA